ncbi:Plasmodium vivax Vir protein, putative [Plasmodium vivax]|nr:Plasmodium vivax Vir protein, putative [Plasmodium vivax]
MYTILESDIGYYEEGVYKTEIINLLKKQKLYNLYDQFDIELESSHDLDNCNGECNKISQKMDGMDLKLIELCKKMCKVLLNSSKIQGFCTENTCCGKFPYLNIWLYETIKKISSSSSSSLINNFYDTLDIIRKTKTSKMEYCRIINFYSLGNNYMHMKYLYEFLHIFRDIIEESSNNDGWKEKLYCKHIQQFFQYYNKIKKNCTKQSRITYCNEVDLIQNSIGRDMINTILSKCDYEETKCENDSYVSSVIPCLKDKDFKPTSQKIDGVPDELVRTLSTGIISLIPIVTTFSIFYKFTPLGYWLRSKMLKKKNITEHMREVNHDILDHNSRIEEINLNNDRYNIKYN